MAWISREKMQINYMYSQCQIPYLSSSIRAQRSGEGKLFLIHGAHPLVDLSDAEGEERGTRMWLRYLRSYGGGRLCAGAGRRGKGSIQGHIGVTVSFSREVAFVFSPIPSQSTFWPIILLVYSSALAITD
jgi:hypothetical protein